MSQTEQSGGFDGYEQAELWMGEAQQSVSLTSFMTAVGFFFIGLLLTGSETLQLRLRVPLAFLFMSSFGFLYATLVYANASGEIARLRKKGFEKQMSVGNILSEYLGVYCLAFAAPLVVLGYSPDEALAVIVLIISLSGWLLYHMLGYSILERYFSGWWFRGTVGLLAILYVLSFLSFLYRASGYFYGTAVALAATVVLLTAISLQKGES